MFIQRNGTVKFANNSGSDFTPPAQNNSAAYENHTPEGRSNTNEVNVDQQSNYENNFPSADTELKSQMSRNQVSVAYAKPIKNRKEEEEENASAPSSHDKKKTTNGDPEDPVYSEPAEISNVEDLAPRQEESHDISNEHTSDDKEGWENNSLYSMTHDPEEDPQYSVTHESETIHKPEANDDTARVDIENTPKDQEEIENDYQNSCIVEPEYSEIGDKNNGEFVAVGGSTATGAIDEDESACEGWADNNIYAGSDDD